MDLFRRASLGESMPSWQRAPLIEYVGPAVVWLLRDP